MPRILFVSHSSSLGGAERCLVQLLAGLDRRRYEPRVCARRRPHPLSPRNDLAAALRPLQIAVQPVELRWWARDWTHDAAFIAGLRQRVAVLRETIRRGAIDLVMSNSIVAPEGALAAAACGVPHVWHVLEMLSRDPQLHPFLPLERMYALVGEWSHRVVAVSQAVRDELHRFAPQAPVEVVHTGIEPPRPRGPIERRALGWADDAPLVTFVGLHSARKGTLDFVECARLVHGTHPAARFLMVGRDGGQAREAARRIAAAGLKGVVQMLGLRDDVPELLAASAVFVLPALADPLPVAVLEAMSLGVPIVATRSGGCEEMIRDGETGLLTPPRDPAALAAAVGRMLDDDSLRRACGERGRARFNAHFSRQQYVAGFCRIFDEALAAGCPPRDIEPWCAELTAAAQERRQREGGRAPFGARCRAAALTLAYRAGVIH